MKGISFMQIQAVNYLNTNVSMNQTKAMVNKEEVNTKEQINETYSSQASAAIRNIALASVKKPEVNSIQIATATMKGHGEMTDTPRSYENGRFQIKDSENYNGEKWTKTNAGELVITGDDGRRIATDLNGVTNRFKAEAVSAENGHYGDVSVKTGVRFNEVEEKYGDYAILNKDGEINFYDKDDNNIGTMKASVRENEENKDK